MQTFKKTFSALLVVFFLVSCKSDQVETIENLRADVMYQKEQVQLLTQKLDQANNKIDSLQQAIRIEMQHSFLEAENARKLEHELNKLKNQIAK